MLPKACLKRIEGLCSRFLWAGNITHPKPVKISWNSVCLPKQEGGLGLRRYTTWNKALCLRYIWAMFSGHRSLWSLWHSTHSLRNQCFWELKPRSSDSWIWKSLLHQRPWATTFIKGLLGNGKTLSFWYDSWTPFGPLLGFMGTDGPRKLNIRLSAKVEEAAPEGVWRLPNPRCDKSLEFLTHLTTIPPPTSDAPHDSYVWLTNGTASTSYSSSRTWEVCRPFEIKKSWFNIVWFKGALPKHAFHMWVANLNRLPTRSRLFTWGLAQNPDCCFCGSYVETRDHLLLTCGYSLYIWKLVLQKLDITHCLFNTWRELLSWLKKSSQNAPSTLRKMTAHSALYNIWKQRNNILFNNQVISAETIFINIYKEVKNLISARRHRSHFKDLMSKWIQ